nr:MAG TPA: hypothetical protein [Caudoviricetes sp.]
MPSGRTRKAYISTSTQDDVGKSFGTLTSKKRKPEKKLKSLSKEKR